MGFGIDFGGTTVKGAPVDLSSGRLLSDQVTVPTPSPATPDALREVIVEVVGRFPDDAGGSDDAVGVTVPGVVRGGVVSTAANIDPSWIGTDADALFTEALGREVHIVNDADAAGLAEVHHGAATGRRGLVVVTTLGTGIGTALVHDGVLVPNSELGHLELDGVDAETVTANSARVREGLDMATWAVRLTRYYRALERLLNPDLFVVGGGVSAAWDEFGHLIEVDTEIVPAALRNDAGIVGAALAAATS
jgi:polyphosphate glucokinase